MMNNISFLTNVNGGVQNNVTPSINKENKIGKEGSTSFTEMIQKTIETVDQTSKEADTIISEMATGKNIDIHNAMIAVEKADISFQFIMQLRNKMLAAYQEINRMQV